MEYKYTESLLLSAKSGDLSCTEKLIEEFTPFIKNLSRKTFIPGYTSEDIQHECIITLYNCIEKYNPETHRFVAYATNAIKNNLNYLIRKNLVHREVTSQDSLTLTGSLEDLYLSCDDKLDEDLINSHTKKIILEAVNVLSDEQKELLIYVQLKKNTLKSYAALKNISYSAASKKKIKVMEILNDYINNKNNEI